MGGEELRWLLDADVHRDRPEGRAEGFDCLLRLEHVEDEEPIRAFPGGMDQEALEREIRWRVDTRPSPGESADHFLVPLAGQAGCFMHGEDHDRNPLGDW